MIALKASSFATLQFTFNRNRRFHQWLSQANSRKCAVFCSIDRPKWNPRTHSPKHNHNNHSESSGKKKNKFTDDDDDDDEEEEGGERKVHCEVEVISWRERRIKAEILVNADIESVWDALTDYERLADFIPNLVCRSSTTSLSYEVNVIPRFNFPAIFLERIIRSDLPVNLQALACRSEKNFEGNQKIPFIESSLGTASIADVANPGIDLDGALSVEKLSPGVFKKSHASSSFDPLFQSSSELSSNWGVFGKVCKLDRPCMVDEVHLRRFDGLLENGGVHRCVVASMTVKAPVREVWNVLTAYETLPEIVPNLAISKILSRENNKVRILQEGCKGLLYMVLHARAVLDICEQLEQEISFEQVEGDFDSFQGKWILEQLGNQHTLLKYTVESKMHRDSFLSEAIMEEVIYEDLPSNLCAIRDYIEKREASNSLETSDYVRYSEEQFISSSNGRDVDYHPKPADEVSDVSGPNPLRQRPRVPGLQRNIEVLKAELLKFILEHGQEGFMPMRKQLRKHGRVDIEKAITRMGGFRRIASLMNLSLAYKHRKPKGYWDNLETLKEEITRFQRSWGMDPSYMPSRKTFERAGRYDIARALEKWGGLHEVSRLLSLKVRHPNRQPNLTKHKRSDFVASPDMVVDEDRTTSKPYVPQDAQKWLMSLQHLDINWVE
ncbi:uncharacterized protein LOC117919017 isoform X2 [Vitis riparia]|uniref:uncharacterized protein LOC117919017 isoform X2 n=1 Tax=Vitis riparia TaxID=96939 RepID=UPI00155AA95A|nr:uncharacterized protein LOC117919017 isoform X2 [Vitis riparia]